MLINSKTRYNISKPSRTPKLGGNPKKERSSKGDSKGSPGYAAELLLYPAFSPVIKQRRS